MNALDRCEESASSILGASNTSDDLTEWRKSRIHILSSEKSALVEDLERERNAWSALYDNQIAALRRDHSATLQRNRDENQRLRSKVEELSQQLSDCKMKESQRSWAHEKRGLVIRLEKYEEEIQGLRDYSHHDRTCKEEKDLCFDQMKRLKQKISILSDENANLMSLLMNIQQQRRKTLAFSLSRPDRVGASLAKENTALRKLLQESRDKIEYFEAIYIGSGKQREKAELAGGMQEPPEVIESSSLSGSFGKESLERSVESLEMTMYLNSMADEHSAHRMRGPRTSKFEYI
jgi:hypothetical protein